MRIGVAVVTRVRLTKMEAEYLKRTVGRPLAAGLAEVAAKRPGDPIEYLAQWLVKYKDNTAHQPQEGDYFLTEEVPEVSAHGDHEATEEKEREETVPVSEEPPPTDTEPPPSQPPPSEKTAQEPPNALSKIDEETGEQLARENADT